MNTFAKRFTGSNLITRVVANSFISIVATSVVWIEIQIGNWYPYWSHRGRGVAYTLYTLVTCSGPADLWTLDTAQTATAILSLFLCVGLSLPFFALVHLLSTGFNCGWEPTKFTVTSKYLLNELERESWDSNPDAKLWQAAELVQDFVP